MIFLQLPVPPPGSIENAAIAFAAIASLVVLAKKLLPRTPASGEFVVKSDFRDLTEKVDALRDKLDTRLVSLSDRLERLGDSLHRRLNDLEAGLARVDERTRK
jgi:hypothetical protein